MKKALLFLVAFTLVFSMALPAFAWSSKDHINCIKSTDGIESMFTADERALLYKCSTLPDDQDYRYYYKDPSSKEDVNSLHARGNYISCQRYLYEMAIAVKNSSIKPSLSKTATSEDVKTFLTNYLNSCTYLTRDERSRMDLVNHSVEALITTKIIKTNTDDYEMSKRKRSIKILGFLAHLIGDSYAHATIVPSSAVFKQADFKDSVNYTAAEKWTDFQNIIEQYDICFADLDSLSTSTKIIYNRGTSTTTDLTTVYPSKKLAAISKDLSSTKYEDNTNFLSARFEAACTVTSEILTDYNSGVGTYNKEYMRYFQEQGTDYTMRQFDTYYAAF